MDETEFWTDVEAELTDLWMNDPPEMEESGEGDEVVTEEDLSPDRDEEDSRG